MAKKEAGPSKSDLLNVLKGYERYYSQETLKLIKIEEDAQRALGEFLQNNEQYRALEKAREEAYDARYAEERRVQELLRSRLREIRNQILTHGPGPKAVEMIEKLQKDFQ